MPVVLPKSAFYHIPKTGGMWVSAVLLEMFGRDYCKLGTIGPQELGLFDPHDPPDTFPVEGDRYKFTFVRNPITWYMSRWARSMEQGWSERNKIGRDLRDSDFNKFVDNCVEEFPGGLLTTIYGRFVNEVDFVGKYENLRKDLIKALRNAGETFDREYVLRANPVNVTHIDYKNRAVYKEDVLKRMIKAEKWVFDTYKYKKGVEK